MGEYLDALQEGDRRPVKVSDMDRLRGDAPPSTHLARYERAHDAGARRVLRVACPDCGARANALCAVGS